MFILSSQLQQAVRSKRQRQVKDPAIKRPAADTPQKDYSMKTHKRNSTGRAYAKGYRSGINGKSKDTCHHIEGDNRSQWLGGWREGRADQWDGYIGVSGIQKAVEHHL